MGRGTDILALERIRAAAAQAGTTALAARGRIGSGASGPFFIWSRAAAPISGWVFVPAGLVYRLQAPDDSTETAPQIEMGNALISDFFRDPWVRKIQSNYYFMAGEERLWPGDRAGAMAAYEQAAATAFDSRTTRFNVALKLFEIGELDRAMSHAADAAAIDPWQPTPYRLMARIEQEQGRYDEARALAEKSRGVAAGALIEY